MSSKIAALIESVRGEVRRREETDRRISTAWIFIPLVAAIFTVVLLISSFALGPAAALASLALVIVLAFIIGIVYVYLLYLLISRRNKHFARQIRLFEATTSALREIARAKGVDAEARLVGLERAVREARDEEPERGAVLWAVLSYFISILSLYVYYFLMRDFYSHERREDRILEDINHTLSALGAMPLPRRVSELPHRGFAVYLVLSMVTLGIFAIYWAYTLITDPNTHFKEQARIEDDLLKRLEGLAA